MTLLISALAFLLLLSFLVLIHELGHFAVARWCGVEVEEFGFGLPPPVKTLFVKGGTRFSFNWIPFGGFVRLKGENAIDERDRTAPGSFGGASIPARIAILVAGVAMNFIFAMVIFTLGFSLWGWTPTYLSLDQLNGAAARGEIRLDPGVRIAALVDGGTAAAAKIPTPSLLLSIDGRPMYAPTEVVDAQKDKTTVTYVLRVLGEATERTVTLPVVAGKTGVDLAYDPQVNSPPRSVVTSVILSLREAHMMTVQTAIGVAHLAVSLVSRAEVPEGITGIVGIAVLTHDSLREGFMHYLRLIAVLSLSLAVLNIFPFPALDGGRLVFVLFEWLCGRPAPRNVELATNAVGFFLLIGLILVITYNDILHLF